MPIADKLVIVHAGNSMEAGFVQSLLKEYGIAARLQDEMMGTIAPQYVAPGGIDAVKVIVLRSDYERAKAIIAEFLDDENIAAE